MADVLIVDDSVDTGRALRGLLRIAGHTADCMTGGQQALAYLAERQLPTVVLLDWMMPDVTGADVLRRVRSDPRLAGLPIVVYTALCDSEVRAQAEGLGASDFVTKNVPWDELYSQLRRHLP